MERERSIKKLAVQSAAKIKESKKTYARGDSRKNTRIMLDALGLSIRRKMLARLAREGAMSLSKLAEPFNITLPAALMHIRTLELAGIITTHKKGRIRFCVYNPESLKELATQLKSKNF